MENVNVRFVNEREVLQTIQRLAQAVGIENAKLIVGTEGVKDQQRRFIAKNTPEGAPWRQTRHRTGETMRDTARLFNSLTYQFVGDTVNIGTNDKRARLLHFGGRVKSSRSGGYLALRLDGMGRATNLRSRYPDAFVLRLGGKDYGNDRLWLVRRTEKSKKNSFDVEGRGKLQFLALLVKWVEIPGRAFVGLSREGQDAILQRLTEAARKAWND